MNVELCWLNLMSGQEVGSFTDLIISNVLLRKEKEDAVVFLTVSHFFDSRWVYKFCGLVPDLIQLSKILYLTQTISTYICLG